MAEYFAFQAALCFSIAHIFVRRGLLHSNALTGSLISLGTSAAVFWLLALAWVPLSTLRAPGVGYFVAAGVFAPAIGQTLGYVGMEKIGVARSAPIVNTSPIFSSVFAVFILGEVWTRQNMLGTCLVIVGIIVLSSSKAAAGEWRKKDIIYPLLGAVAFGISTTLRKSGLMTVPRPLLAAAVTVGTAFVVLLVIIRVRGGRRALKFHRQSNGWLFGAALVNTGAILSFFSALNLGKVVRVEPLVACNPLLTILWAAIFLRQIERLSPRIIFGALVTVAGTVLVVTAR
ncbi:MAG: DMT family transporter [Deltaproteobacteria bacterium]|nr:DMT family transporter [Deltaproteobacteria bacterium]MBI2180629.1 DMT family transporter [Deltaproteobacteria bacterium]MBI2228224.1 DMT family transporter [Deltaproteobacteria bacterium]MBI2532801.1 DMT family transporter [Deltaproteobacteria bacterium]